MNLDMPRNRDEVIKCVEEHTREYPESESSFGHIVLGDFNLSDHRIRWCLEKKQIDDWMIFRTQRAAQRNGNDEDGFKYDMEQLELVKTKTVDFLNWLLTIPEDIREGATNEP